MQQIFHSQIEVPFPTLYLEDKCKWSRGIFIKKLGHLNNKFEFRGASGQKKIKYANSDNVHNLTLYALETANMKMNHVNDHHHHPPSTETPDDQI